MSEKKPAEQAEDDESFRGCFTILVALVVAFGTLCAVVGIFMWSAFSSPRQEPGKQPNTDNSKVAPIRTPRSGVDQGATSSTDEKSKNRLRQIMLAMHGHHSDSRTFPPPLNAAYDSAGKPLLSWRVHLLPFLGQNPLYAQFHLGEPWDSEHNSPLLDKMPDAYRSRGIAPDGNRTGFIVFQNPDMYPIGKGGLDVRRISDGTSNTLLVVEVGPEIAVPWTRPDDISFDSTQPLSALGRLPNDGFWGGFADGSVRRIRRDIKPEVFRGVLTPSGGEVIQFERDVEFR